MAVICVPEREEAGKKSEDSREFFKMSSELETIAALWPNTRDAALSLRKAGFDSFEDLCKIDPSSEFMSSAVFILGMSEKKKFVPFLSRFVDGTGALSFESVIAISRLGGETAYRNLRHWMLKSPIPYLRYQATWGVGHLSDRDSAFTVLLGVATNEKEYPEIRGEAIEGMAYRLNGDKRHLRYRRSCEVVLKLLQDPHPEVRFWACFAASSLPAPAIIRQLEQMVGDKSKARGFWSVGEEAQDALAMMRGQATPNRKGGRPGAFSWENLEGPREPAS